MKSLTRLLLGTLLLLGMTPAFAADEQSYAEAMANFKQASETKKFFDNAYGYALFPTIGKGGIGIGAAYGKGRVFRAGVHVGNSSMTQLSIGLQLGGQAYSEIIFFKDEAAFNDFTSGTFEFSGQASAVAINAGASAQAGTTGNSASAGQSGGAQSAKANYIHGMAVFTAAKGGLMFEAALAGQKFNYEAK
ncbi:hypothetical protein KJI95_12645 [Shewanella sp. JM162201]|uniref:Ysc84 actin-binding domain-containing protein n=1 Tax=Shewanella jiangmenensis TaxID=2837387 RepID=A0ABS5V6N0_9GAMM|nr:YSC84-related protein [Shewanella jiangmenensis]MBT1445369.1 hypothetical protein [Shewanella jiangmenensis]